MVSTSRSVYVLKGVLTDTSKKMMVKNRQVNKRNTKVSHSIVSDAAGVVLRNNVDFSGSVNQENSEKILLIDSVFIHVKDSNVP